MRRMPGKSNALRHRTGSIGQASGALNLTEASNCSSQTALGLFEGMSMQLMLTKSVNACSVCAHMVLASFWCLQMQKVLLRRSFGPKS